MRTGAAGKTMRSRERVMRMAVGGMTPQSKVSATMTVGDEMMPQSMGHVMMTVGDEMPPQLKVRLMTEGRWRASKKREATGKKRARPAPVADSLDTVAVVDVDVDVVVVVAVADNNDADGNDSLVAAAAENCPIRPEGLQYPPPPTMHHFEMMVADQQPSQTPVRRRSQAAADASVTPIDAAWVYPPHPPLEEEATPGSWLVWSAQISFRTPRS